MKLQDLFEEQRIIKKHIKEPDYTTNLDYEGVIVRGNFDCSYTKIKSLKGAPKATTGYFYCYATSITSIEGAPSHVGGTFNCHSTKIKSLHNIHKQVGYIGGYFYLSSTTKSHVLGVMKIKGLKQIEFVDRDRDQIMVAKIINKHLDGDRNVHDCQEELLEAGFGEYAKL